MWLVGCIVFLLLTWAFAVRTQCLRILLELKDRIVFAWSLPGPGYFDVAFHSTSDKALPWLIELSRIYGPLYRVWFMEDLTVFVSDPDDLKEVLSSHDIIDKSFDYGVLSPWLGSGLLTNGGKSWQRQRKLLTPAFHFKILGTFKEPIHECCKIMVDKLRPSADGVQVVDIYPFVSMCALDVICETAMGIKINAQQNSDSEIVQATHTVCNIVHEQLFSIWQRFSFLFELSANGRQQRKSLNVLHNLTKRAIRTRRHEMATEAATLTAESARENGDDTYGQKQRFAFLDSLLNAQQSGIQLTDQNIEDEVNTFMFEGHDTVSSAISFALYLMSKHAEVQQRAFEEACQFEGNESETMPYMEAVIKETLRLFPSVPFYSRNVVEPFRLGGRHIIPKGTTVAILAYVAHRNPDVFVDPERFDPQRFLDGRNASYHPFAHVAFSAGPRNCIGQRFAMLELKCTLSTVLRTFELLPGPDGCEPQLLTRLILNSANGTQMRLRERTI